MTVLLFSQAKKMAAGPESDGGHFFWNFGVVN